MRGGIVWLRDMKAHVLQKLHDWGKKIFVEIRASALQNTDRNFCTVTSGVMVSRSRQTTRTNG